MKVGDLVIEHIDDQIGIIIAVDGTSLGCKVLFPSGYSGWFSMMYLEWIA